MNQNNIKSLKKFDAKVLAIIIVELFFFNWLGAQHTNVFIGNKNAPNEPSICINPQNTNQMVAAANIDNVYYSKDAGANWTQVSLSCPWGIWGDPVLAVDTAGAFYFIHLSNPPAPGNWIDRIISQKSLDGGKTWSQGSFTGLNGNKAQDKHWISVDKNTNALYLSWTQFDKYGSNKSTDSSNILFSKSIDGGESWTLAKRINKLGGDCVDSDNTAEGAVPCIGPEGQIYIAWSNQNKIWFDRSSDKGETWLNEDIFITEQPGGWDYNIPGIYRANGLPFTTCDLSNGPHHGTIYVNWSDQRNGENDTDIWLAKSKDGGNTWTPPVKVNNDGGNAHQFFTNMAIDQATGWLWFVFYDRRNYSNENTDVYMALSKDGGETFLNFKISESAFFPSSNFFFGDYTGISVHNNIVRPIWTRLSGNELSVWTALVNPDAIATAIQESSSPLAPTIENPYPNPSSNSSGFSFKLRKKSMVSLWIADLQGNKLNVILNNEVRAGGKYLEKIDTNSLNLKSGTYFIVLSIDGKQMSKQLMVVDKA
ncbi:MAG: T9SS type A sorting domain-containing protein [Saprospiraceae bacterium]|nr:T9SS type A sorting domain-containing protein [Candidatus Vicinibacter affinis]MBP6173121.1 T9SS type A sorting domain-containing protein [Saprospiraceae bacterium]MBK6573476.1 T9SS type A sorting domain-containing protein [Candidatus Vicinibacter affinis]MBK6822045.1 T9SS type A sorting domain-containing protein [Candidatus Vicinibacter affinis]MBK7302157.1 T9SS type A sorting domain-containing protein [Candidatus Vicinibacter affinis]